MSLHRRAAKRDSNEGPIVQALQAQGFHVTRISGAGVPDLLVSKQCGRYDVLGWTPNGALTEYAKRGVCWLVEVKTPKGRYQKAQIAFREAWCGPPIITLRSVEDALRFQLLAMESGC